MNLKNFLVLKTEPLTLFLVIMLELVKEWMVFLLMQATTALVFKNLYKCNPFSHMWSKLVQVLFFLSRLHIFLFLTKNNHLLLDHSVPGVAQQMYGMGTQPNVSTSAYPTMSGFCDGTLIFLIHLADLSFCWVLSCHRIWR